MISKDVIIVGGGAAGFFAAINLAKRRPDLKICILERGNTVLNKVKVSGGGRCNVTHAEFIPRNLIENYPRGDKELLGPFHQFMTGDTITWFEKRGVSLKIEDDGRMFPESDSSQTIIDCFLNEAQKHGVEILLNHSVKNIQKEGDRFIVGTNKNTFDAESVLVAAGSNPKIWELLKELGHTIVAPVPSLFTFNCKDDRIKDIPGVVVPHVHVKILNTDLESTGPLLMTHWGFSAPAILKLSAFGAIELAACNYKFDIEINFITMDMESAIEKLKTLKHDLSKKLVRKSASFDIPKRLWEKLVLSAGINENMRWAELNKNQLEALADQLTQAVFNIDGKSTFKEEFVTAGGVDLKEVNFKTFESKCCENLYFAGEVLNIDAITGGFNFQNAWTGAFIAAQNIGA
ncbi:BaiN/RdsA family NAD(P)/FAD-dependent oxidoreductase [Gaetbulibacter aestuarii]|uniref:NAD(P)/FAD-dependent oxidoreductase n=1 Tax=Gaetbulibacter aestuarii TaxID=1502358 RepID=A0ABW7MW94_9FLAO